MRPRSTSTLLAIALAGFGCQPKPGPESVEPVATKDTPPAHESGAPDSSELEADAGPERPEGAIFRSELIRATGDGNPAYLLRELAPEPYRPQQRFEGWVITRVWPGDPELCKPGCDLRSGDIILSVNGSTLETPEALSNMLARLDELDSLEVKGIRDGQFYERSYPILADPALPE